MSEGRGREWDDPGEDPELAAVFRHYCASGSVVYRMKVVEKVP